MRLIVVAVGAMKDGPERDLLARYLERASAMARSVGVAAVQLVEIDESRARTAEQRRRDEATLIRGRLPPDAVAILLDESGRSLPSEAFAALVGKERDGGTPSLAFVIGGADGLDRAWRADHRTVSFGAATFPHQLVRIMLAEQIYRAFTILAGHPYHRA